MTIYFAIKFLYKMLSTKNRIGMALAILSILLFSACENDEKEVDALINLKQLGVEVGKNITSYYSTGGKTKAKLTAPLMLRNQYDSSKVEFTKTLHVDFFDSALVKESELFAKYGKYLENENTVLLKDSVIVFNTNQDTLWCNELIWDQNKAAFFTDKPVIIKQNNGTYSQKVIAKKGLYSNQSFTSFTLFQTGKFFNPNTDSYILLKDSSSYY